MTPEQKKPAPAPAAPKKPEQRTFKQLRINMANPRAISEEKLEMLDASVKEFGDLGGIVFNKKTGRLIGGHQRKKVIPPDCPIQITKRYDKPTATGTVAEGYVIYDDDRFAYREVYWHELKEYAAMIAANKHGGRWNNKILADLVLTLDQNNIPMKPVGFSQSDLEALLAPTNPHVPDAPSAQVPDHLKKQPEEVTCPHCQETFRV